ncbi:MAG: hypothetical protein RLZZ450_5259 [Pseudomonadota bacterium]
MTRCDAFFSSPQCAHVHKGDDRKRVQRVNASSGAVHGGKSSERDLLTATRKTAPTATLSLHRAQVEQSGGVESDSCSPLTDRNDCSVLTLAGLIVQKQRANGVFTGFTAHQMAVRRTSCEAP